jgi:hypothetical protein
MKITHTLEPTGYVWTEIAMPKTPFGRPRRQLEPVPSIPQPSSASASEGMEIAQETARRYLLNSVHLWAAVAFAPDSEARLHTRVRCAQLLAAVAGAIPQAVPEAPRPHDEDGDGGDHA